MKRKLSLYIHVPFCVQKCLYCDFLSTSAQEETKQQYVDSLIEEIEYWRGRICGSYQLQTIFIGGGTPTCLSPVQLQQIGNAIHGMESDKTIEFTIEANPGTITEEHLDAMQQIGINRVSLGLQSAQNLELKLLGRIHTYEDFEKTFQKLRQRGFGNINVDLMADIPAQTISSYHDTLRRMIALEPEHISSYSLIVEEGTPFYQMQKRGELQIPDEDTDRQMYELTRTVLKEHGYQRYEISNYAKPERECRHNLAYWRMQEYLGIGLGASSYFMGNRFSNTSDLQAYLSEKPDRHCAETHVLSRKEEMEEFVFLGLRTMKGICKFEYKKRFGLSLDEVYPELLPELLQNGLLAESDNRDRIYLTNHGIDVSNYVLAEFLL